MSQQRFTPSTGTHARPTSHAVSVVHVPGRHALVSAQTGAPETSGRQRVRRPRQSERPHGVPDTDGMHGINRLSVSAMNESTVSSTLAALLPFGLKQPPLASARANVVRNAASAWARQSGLTALFRRTAIAWHRSLASLFRLTALSFASAHFIARRADDDSAPFAGAAPRTTPTSTAVATFIRTSHPTRLWKSSSTARAPFYSFLKGASRSHVRSSNGAGCRAACRRARRSRR